MELRLQIWNAQEARLVGAMMEQLGALRQAEQVRQEAQFAVELGQMQNKTSPAVDDAPPTPAGEAEQPPEVEQPKVKRTRNRKVAAVAELAASYTLEPADAPKKYEATGPAIVPTFDDTADALKKFSTKKTIADAVGLLGRYGVARLSELPEAKRAELIAEINAELAK